LHFQCCSFDRPSFFSLAFSVPPPQNGGTENERLENAELENAALNCSTGNARLEILILILASFSVGNPACKMIIL